MRVDLAAHLEKLLFLHDQLNIPSFGGFVVRRTPAATDYVGGTVSPPSKTLTFNENLTTDDGLLVQDIANTHGISVEDARHVVQDFVDKLQHTLNQREIVTLPGIGRLYKNYVQKIQFLPDSTNFDTEAYGLPPLQFTPIARSRNVEEPSGAAAPVPAPAMPATPPSPPLPPPNLTAMPETAWTPKPDTSSRLLALFGVLLLFAAIGLGIWWLQRSRANEDLAGREPSSVAGDDRPRNAEGSPDERGTPAGGRTNDPAGQSKQTQPAAESPKTSRPAAKPAPVTPPAEEPRPSTAEPPGEGRLAVLIVATLREEANADRLIGLLEREGYDVYLLQKNGYQVGIQFRYQDVEEIQDKIVALQRLTGEPNIWIKKR
jgi:nucleoid DNA-binding protein